MRYKKVASKNAFQSSAKGFILGFFITNWSAVTYIHNQKRYIFLLSLINVLYTLLTFILVLLKERFMMSFICSKASLSWRDNHPSTFLPAPPRGFHTLVGPSATEQVAHVSSHHRHRVTHGAMPGFISGRPGLCGPSAPITTRFPAKIFTAHGRVQFTVDAIIRADDDAGDAMHHVGGNGGVCATSKAKKENNSEAVLFAFLAGTGGQTCAEPTLNRRVSPQCWCVCFCVMSSVMISIWRDKSQRRSWDGFMTSFTLHFQPWATFWLGL